MSQTLTFPPDPMDFLSCVTVSGVKASCTQQTPPVTHSVTPDASGVSAWVSSTVYESTGFRFPDSQQMSAASSQLRISLLFITGGEGAGCRTKGEMNSHSAHTQPVCPEPGQTARPLSLHKRDSVQEEANQYLCLPNPRLNSPV